MAEVKEIEQVVVMTFEASTNPELMEMKEKGPITEKTETKKGVDTDIRRELFAGISSKTNADSIEIAGSAMMSRI